MQLYGEKEFAKVSKWVATVTTWGNWTWLECNKKSKLQTTSKARTNMNVIEDTIYTQNFGARATKMQSTPTITLETESRLSISDNKQDV